MRLALLMLLMFFCQIAFGQSKIVIEDYNSQSTQQVFTIDNNDDLGSTISRSGKYKNEIEVELIKLDDKKRIIEFDTIINEPIYTVNFDYISGKRKTDLSDYGKLVSPIKNNKKYGVFVFSRTIQHNFNENVLVSTFNINYYYDNISKIMTILVMPIELGNVFEQANNNIFIIYNGKQVARIEKIENSYIYYFIEDGKSIKIQSLTISNDKQSKKFNIFFQTKYENSNDDPFEYE